MASLSRIIKGDRHPTWLVDAIILSAAVYVKDPQEELDAMDKEYGLPATARYEFISEDELAEAGFAGCRQTLIVVKSLTGGHYIVACRGTTDMSDALVDFNIVHRTMSLGEGSAHAGFLDRAKSIPLDYLRRLLIRNENIVLTGHSLGGAVASLLTLRLLETTGTWCHEQLQCYTFGCPFFADYRLAQHINAHYKHHFVHLVSRADFVPKLMPVAYTLYSLWAGLQVGPLEDLFHCSRMLMLGMQLTKTKFKINQKISIVAMATQALTWFPALSRFVLHRLIALALSFHSGYGYAFAGQMVLIGPETSAFELADRERWTVNTHLSFHLGGVSMDCVKQHSLLSYIDHVFSVQATLTTGPTSPNRKVHTATVNMKVQYKNKQNHQDSGQRVNQPRKLLKRSSGLPRRLGPNNRNEKKAVRALKNQVACVIFARRMRETSFSSFKDKKEHKNRGLTNLIVKNFVKVSKFVHRFDRLFLFSSILCAGFQMRRIFQR